MTDTSGNIRAEYNYDPWGRRTRVGGDLDADFGFTGHYYHAPSGLDLTLYRAYSADLGRWLNRDPMGERRFEVARNAHFQNSPALHPPAEITEGPNLYAYVGNDPLQFMDPLGLSFSNWQGWASIVAGGAALGAAALGQYWAAAGLAAAAVGLWEWSDAEDYNQAVAPAQQLRNDITNTLSNMANDVSSLSSCNTVSKPPPTPWPQ
jgi:RHS repeat-associated protein